MFSGSSAPASASQHPLLHPYCNFLLLEPPKLIRVSGKNVIFRSLLSIARINFIFEAMCSFRAPSILASGEGFRRSLIGFEGEFGIFDPLFAFGLGQLS